MRIIQTVFLTLIICGCHTYSVWSDTDAPKYLEVRSEIPDQDVEKEIQASNKKYFCKTYIEHKNDRIKNTKVCYVEVPSAVRLKSYGAKLLHNPKALAMDAGMTVLIVGYIIIAAPFISGNTNQN